MGASGLSRGSLKVIIDGGQSGPPSGLGRLRDGPPHWIRGAAGGGCCHFIEQLAVFPLPAVPAILDPLKTCVLPLA